MRIEKLKNNLKSYSDNIFIQFIIKLIIRLRDHNVTAIAAQLSYYLFVSIFPFIIVFLNILSYTPLAQLDVLSELIKYLPMDIQKIIISLVSETVQSSNETLLSFGAITGLWAASKGALAFIRVMNAAYDVKEDRNFVETRILSIIITIGLFLSFILVLATLVFGEIIASKLFSIFGFASNFIHFWKYFRKLLALVSMIVIFALLFKVTPAQKNKKRIKFIEVLPGAVFSSLGWVITSLGFSYYVNNFGNFAKTYGSLGGILALLLWLYMSSIIMILGGEINASIECLNRK